MSDRAYREPTAAVGIQGLHRNLRLAAYGLLGAAAVVAASACGSVATNAYCAPREDSPLCRLLRTGPSFDQLHVPWVVSNFLAAGFPWLPTIALAGALVGLGLVARTVLAVDGGSRAIVVQRRSLLRGVRTERIALDAIERIVVRRALGFAAVEVVDEDLVTRAVTGWRWGRRRAEWVAGAIEAARIPHAHRHAGSTRTGTRESPGSRALSGASSSQRSSFWNVTRAG